MLQIKNNVTSIYRQKNKKLPMYILLKSRFYWEENMPTANSEYTYKDDEFIHWFKDTFPNIYEEFLGYKRITDNSFYLPEMSQKDKLRLYNLELFMAAAMRTDFNESCMSVSRIAKAILTCEEKVEFLNE